MGRQSGISMQWNTTQDQREGPMVITRNLDESQSRMLCEASTLKRLHTGSFHLYNNLKRGNHGNDEELNNARFSGWG